MVLGFTHSDSAPHWWRAVCAKATNNQLLTELKSTFLLKQWRKKKNPTLRHTITKPHTTLSHIQYVLQQVQRKMSPTHTWMHFWKKKKKSFILSLVLYLLYPSTLPLPFSLYRCGYLISTIDTKFLFLTTIVLCCAKVRHLVDKSKTKKTERTFSKGKRRDARTEVNQGRGFFFVLFFCFAFRVNTDSDETFYRVEEKQGAAEEKNWSSLSLSLFGHLVSELWRSRSPSGSAPRTG